MKITDLLEMTAVPEDNAERQSLLKSLIERGQKPEVRDATYYRGAFTFGDLEALGFAEHKRQKTFGDYYIEQWVYTGPGPITVGGRVLNSGDKTEPTEADYT